MWDEEDLASLTPNETELILRHIHTREKRLQV